MVLIISIGNLKNFGNFLEGVITTPERDEGKGKKEWKMRKAWKLEKRKNENEHKENWSEKKKIEKVSSNCIYFPLKIFKNLIFNNHFEEIMW